ncbi:MAG TPA: carboxypeptidase-like regulatory domain-containing protein, partial [Bryobacteraceae bacterium]|nr:carboxypeptidase-like regulatory domain-containing protein [Bryobacteraceae bacterium]
MTLGWLSALILLASQHHGQVTFSGLPVPGATVIATQSDKKQTAVTDDRGVYSFADLPDGTWTIKVEMLGFSTMTETVAISPNAPGKSWELKMLPLDQINAQTKMAAAPAHATPPPPSATPAPQRPSAGPVTAPAPSGNDSQSPDDGFLINGSVNNGAASPFAQFPAFGNRRGGPNKLYTGGIGITVDNSALDAQQFSITGQQTPKPAYNRLTGLATLGGPIRIPHLMPNGPNFFAMYQWTRNRTVSTDPGLMPTAAERNGNLSQLGNSILDPTTGQPF